MMVGVSKCAHCPSPEGRNVLSGENLCDDCARHNLVGHTADLDGDPRLVIELPVPKGEPRPCGPQRNARRGKAERAALAKLKLIHLDEFNALYAAELHRHGLRPAAGVSFDVHLRKLAGSRLHALSKRMTDAH